MEPVIAIREVNHYFGSGDLRRQILFDVSTDILPGEIVILTGPSGSGKTTLLTLAGALRSVQEGSLLILGRELRGANNLELVSIRSNIGFIFQAHNLLDALTARQNVQMSLALSPELSEDVARTRCGAMLESVGLGHRIEAYPSQLSGGQRQRVAVARALVHQPKIILADEPTAALDRKTGREIVELLHRLAKHQGCAILMVTHDNRILDIADRVLTLEDGRITSFVAGVAANTGRMLSTFAQLQRKGELQRHVSGMSSRQFLDVLDHMTSEFDQFLQIVDLGNQQAVQALFDNMLEAVVMKIRQLLEAERGTLFLVDQERGKLWSKLAETDGAEPLKIEIPIGAGIAGYVARTGQTLNIADPYKHPDFDPEIDQRTSYRTKSILCMPIFDRQRNVFAVAELLNKLNGQPFAAADEQAFRELAPPLGLILESCLRMTQERASAAA
ncbi:MAG: ATP-binding cassette domain-containing protein [Acidobacteriaceae bacterium]|nr:ATP-binding cassette domain-containing protein [Acidobacteriaceae bacterium]